jgi:membrane associated rhomboid family serine protease
MNNYRSSFLGSIPPISKNIIAINIIMWLATIAAPGFFARWGLNIDLTNILGMHYWESTKFNPAQLVTYAFMHGGFWHVAFNMLTLYMFGGILEQMWGSKRFLYYYVITALGAALMQQLVWTVEYHSVVSAFSQAISDNSATALLPFEGFLRNYFNIANLAAFDTNAIIEMKQLFLNLPITVGASGSVFGLLLAFGWLFPEQRIYIYFIPVKARLGVAIFAVAELFLGVANFSFDSVAHFAHLGGMLFGAILILSWRKKY